MTEHWLDFPVPYSRFSLICFIHSINSVEWMFFKKIALFIIKNCFAYTLSMRRRSKYVSVAIVLALREKANESQGKEENPSQVRVRLRDCTFRSFTFRVSSPRQVSVQITDVFCFILVSIIILIWSRSPLFFLLPKFLL